MFGRFSYKLPMTFTPRMQYTDYLSFNNQLFGYNISTLRGQFGYEFDDKNFLFLS